MKGKGRVQLAEFERLDASGKGCNICKTQVVDHEKLTFK